MQFAHKVNKQQHDSGHKVWRAPRKGPPVDNRQSRKSQMTNTEEKLSRVGSPGPKCGISRRRRKYFNIPSQCCSIFAVTVHRLSPLFPASAAPFNCGPGFAQPKSMRRVVKGSANKSIFNIIVYPNTILLSVVLLNRVKVVCISGKQDKNASLAIRYKFLNFSFLQINKYSFRHERL